MQVVTAEAIKGKKVLLRLDLDVPLGKLTGDSLPAGQAGLQVTEDFRLKAGLPTLKLCLENAEAVIIMGHIGRPEGKEVKELSVAPIYDWYEENGFAEDLKSQKLRILENLRFEKGESFDTTQDETIVSEYAKELAALGDIYVNEAFASYHEAASTTVLPHLLPHYAGLRFAVEVERLTRILEDPGRPLVVIIGGAKIEDKLPLIKVMAELADHVLVGGKLISEIEKEPALKDVLGDKVIVGKLIEGGKDITEETVEEWKKMIHWANMVVWNGPLGVVEEGFENSKKIAQEIIDAGCESIVGGGDTVASLGKWEMLGKFNFVSTGGGAMLKFLTDKTLPTIEALR